MAEDTNNTSNTQGAQNAASTAGTYQAADNGAFVAQNGTVAAGNNVQPMGVGASYAVSNTVGAVENPIPTTEPTYAVSNTVGAVENPIPTTEAQPAVSSPNTADGTYTAAYDVNAEKQTTQPAQSAQDPPPQKPRRGWVGVLLIILLIGALATLFTCGAATVNKINQIELTVPASIELYVGDTVDIDYSVTPEDAELTWSASGEAIELNATSVTGIAEGSAQVLVQATCPTVIQTVGGVFGYEPLHATIAVTVLPKPQEDVETSGQPLDPQNSEAPAQTPTASEPTAPATQPAAQPSQGQKPAQTTRPSQPSAQQPSAQQPDASQPGAQQPDASQPGTQPSAPTACQHQWNLVEVTTPASCTEPGTQYYSCSICYEGKWAAIDALSHNYVLVHEATDTAGPIYECSRCGAPQ